MRRGVDDALISAGCIVAILAVLVALDARVREQVQLLLATGRPSPALSGVGKGARDFAWMLFQAGREQCLEHGPLMVFTVVASVLVAFMLRT